MRRRKNLRISSFISRSSSSLRMTRKRQSRKQRISSLPPSSRIQVSSKYFRSGLTDNSRIEEETNKQTDKRMNEWGIDLFLIGVHSFSFPAFVFTLTRFTLIESLVAFSRKSSLGICEVSTTFY